MKNKYSGWDYFRLADESNRKNLTGKEARMLHRELKKHHSGLPMFMRYPNLPLWISIACLLLVLLKPILLGMLR